MNKIAIGSRFCPAVVVCLVAAAAPAGAQLSQTFWVETVSLAADEQLQEAAGPDALAPDRLSEQLSGSGWSLNGGVEFGPAGPPSVTARTSASYQSGLQSFLASSAYTMINFEFRLRQIATPPVPISQVPLTVHSRGTATASGTLPLFASAFVFLDIGTTSGPLVVLDAAASNDPESDPGSASFDETVPFGMGPSETAFGSMAASAQIVAEGLSSGLQGTATAFIDPVVEVADELIPGSSVSYRDVYEVEFSDGYDALGNPTAVKNTQWGDVKSLYRDSANKR